MTKFLYSFREPKDRTPTADSVAAWSVWYQAIGADLVDPGNPARDATVIGNCGNQSTLCGFSVVVADDLDAAIARARGCPGLMHGGGIEVARVFELWPEHAFGATR
jgi:hypothetical protein